MTDALQYYEVIKRAYHNAGQPIPPETAALYGDTLNPSIPRYTYIDPDVTINSRDAFGRPLDIDESMYSYPNNLIMPASAGTNWWDAVFSPAQFADANLSLAGGGTDNTYSVSFNYLRQDGTAAYNRFERGTVRANTAFTVNKLTVGENIRIGAKSRRDKAAASRDIEEARERFPVLGEKWERSGSALSGSAGGWGASPSGVSGAPFSSCSIATRSPAAAASGPHGDDPDQHRL